MTVCRRSVRWLLNHPDEAASEWGQRAQETWFESHQGATLQRRSKLILDAMQTETPTSTGIAA